MNVFELMAKINLDKSGFEKGLDAAKGAMSATAKGLATAAKVGMGAITAASAGVVALSKQAIDSYGEYEQLAGGIETLFKNNSDDMMKYAQEGFKTAGMSVNEYMNTAIQSSAAMINSLGGDTKKAADMTNLSITDMADNVNKMGTNMQSVQDAYRGFSRGNFTMLDNLALGFSGTKEGMQQLLDSAEKISGVKYDISSYSDIVQAIHVVQEEMGITGTTAQEAAHTLQGSASAMKAAWSNLITGVADDNADFSKLVTDFVDSASGVVGNFLPRIETALSGVGDLITALSPIIANAIPGLINQLLPVVIDSATSLITALGSALPQIASSLWGVAKDLMTQFIGVLNADNGAIFEQANSLIENIVDGINQAMPLLFDVAGSVLDFLLQGITETAPTLLEGILSFAETFFGQVAEALPELIPTLIDAALSLLDNLIDFLVDSIDMLIDTGLSLALGLLDGIVAAIPSIVARLPELINSLVTGLLDQIPHLIEAGITLFESLVADLPGIIDSIVPVIPEIITNLIDSILNAMPQIVEAGFKLLVSLVKNLPKVIVTIAQANVKIINSIINAILKSVPKMVTTGFNLLVSIIKNLPKVITLAVKGIGEVLTGIRDAITSFSLVDAGENLIKGVWQGISNVKQWLLDQIQAIFGSAVSLVKKVLGIHSPSTVFAEIGEYCVKGFEKGIEPLADGTLISGAFDNIKNKLGSAYSELELSPVIGSRNVSVYEGQNRTDELLNELLSYFKDDMKDDLTSAMANGVKFDWNNRNLGRMVKTYA